MSYEPANKGNRIHIGVFGRRNVGKSSLLNAVTRQKVSIVSDVPGTTTDPVEKAMELLPLGPVLFIDTAGVDDVGSLGEMRIEKTEKIMKRTDIGIIITECGQWGCYEKNLLRKFKDLAAKVLVVFSKSDAMSSDRDLECHLDEEKIPWVKLSALTSEGMEEFREALFRLAPDELINDRPIVSDLVKPGEIVILVTPIDKEAPKGRLILPQVQTIRDLLDHDSPVMVVKETELKYALDSLSVKPALVVTDSQAFGQVAATVPNDIPLTGFSVLFSRHKGDLSLQVDGARVIDELKPGDRVLIAEACTHHPIADDIGRVKIPNWLEKKAKGKLKFDTVQGHDFPHGLSKYRLVIHCGSCMLSRKETVSRLLHCKNAGVPCTNYGLAIAFCHGIFERALEPFRSVLKI